MRRDATGRYEITSTAGEAVRAFVPAPPVIVEECMGRLEQFIHGDPTGEHALPVLVRAALAHVQFESIHPFLDGNGRLGRLLIVLMRIDAGVLSQPLLYLSLFFKQHRSRYYELLAGVRHSGD
jgi:Fic family protein